MNEIVIFLNLNFICFNLYTWLIVMFYLYVSTLYERSTTKLIPVHIVMSVANKYPRMFVSLCFCLSVCMSVGVSLSDYLPMALYIVYV